jgi:hypothetical protein
MKVLLNIVLQIRTRILVSLIFICLVPISCAIFNHLRTSEHNQKTFGRPPEKPCGLKEVGVFVELEKPSLGSEKISRNQIQGDIEKELRRAGVRVVYQTSLEKSSELPFIYLNVIVGKIGKKYAYNIDIIYLTPLPRPGREPRLTTSNLGTSGLVSEIIQVREKVTDFVRFFIRDCLTRENPAGPSRRM